MLEQNTYWLFIDQFSAIKLEFRFAGGFILMIVWAMTRYLRWLWSIFESLLLYNEIILGFS